MSEQLSNSPNFEKQTTDFVVKMTKDPTSAVWFDAAMVEYDIFKGAKYVGEPGELYEEYEKYNDECTMFALYDGERTIGAIRIIDYNPDVDFKTINDAQQGLLDIDDEGWELIEDINPNDMFEVGTIGLDPEYRIKRGEGMHAVTQLYGVLFAYGAEHEKPHVLASFDERYLRRFERIYGPGVTRLGPAKMYMGSDTVPVLINLNDVHDYLQSAGLQDHEEALLTAGNNVERND
jgi:hypothetical protein